tara:strand:+ start:360 stop:536 length:177 start_codon:yes stop_codon:yes gene_type:complete
MIVGGEKFMWTAYAATWGGMLLYLLSLLKRRRETKAEHELFIDTIGSQGLQEHDEGRS